MLNLTLDQAVILVACVFGIVAFCVIMLLVCGRDTAQRAEIARKNNDQAYYDHNGRYSERNGRGKYISH